MMGMMFLWPLLLLVLVGVCVAGAVWVVQAGSRSRGPSDAGTGGNETPFDIVKRRYAKGEINQQEFEEMRQKLAT
jgi:putative membrane protein